MSGVELVFNPPPGWPAPPPGWQPPAGWTPDPSWPEPPPHWDLWIAPVADPGSDVSPVEFESVEAPAVDVSAAHASEGAGPEAALRARVALLEAEIEALRRSGSDSDEYVILDDDRVLQSVGIYRYHHPLETAAAYKERLEQLSARIVECVKSGEAIVASNLFTFDNSLAKGRRMAADLSRLMLRAYNAEADNVIRSLRVGNVVTARKRLEATRTSIAKLGLMMEMHISDGYHALRLEEIELTADWLMKKQEEKEAVREERERLREERKVEQELAAQRERLDKERAHLVNAIEALRGSGDSDPRLEAKLADLDTAISANDYRRANVRAGYVYVISNRGAFGPGVVKIGLTRRLEPMDRVVELGDASVPFRFDVHAMFFSEDAVTLENELHRHFAGRALNRVNPRKEFFFADPVEVREALVAKVGNLLEFTEAPEATEYLQSVGGWPPRGEGDPKAATEFRNSSAP
jgi:hypothetical protein